MFFGEYIGEPIINPLQSYSDLKSKYPIEIIDLRYQLDHKTPKIFQQFQQYGTDPDNARLFLILNRR